MQLCSRRRRQRATIFAEPIEGKKKHSFAGLVSEMVPLLTAAVILSVIASASRKQQPIAADLLTHRQLSTELAPMEWFAVRMRSRPSDP